MFIHGFLLGKKKVITINLNAIIDSKEKKNRNYLVKKKKKKRTKKQSWTIKTATTELEPQIAIFLLFTLHHIHCTQLTIPHLQLNYYQPTTYSSTQVKKHNSFKYLTFTH